jgi:hypothetical protein
MFWGSACRRRQSLQRRWQLRRQQGVGIGDDGAGERNVLGRGERCRTRRSYSSLLPLRSSASHRLFTAFLVHFAGGVKGTGEKKKTLEVRTQGVRARAVGMVVLLVVALNLAREMHKAQHRTQLRRLVAKHRPSLR